VSRIQLLNILSPSEITLIRAMDSSWALPPCCFQARRRMVNALALLAVNYSVIEQSKKILSERCYAAVVPTPPTFVSAPKPAADEPMLAKSGWWEREMRRRRRDRMLMQIRRKGAAA
jgi:hypothetical protein